MQLSIEKIEAALPKIEAGLNQYLTIQDRYQNTVVSEDRDFQKKFNHFYRVRRGAEWQEPFYQILEDAKHIDYSFSEVLDLLEHATGRLEASFSSKLLATANPDKAVLDSVVLKNLEIKLPYASAKNRKQKIIDVFNKLDDRLNLLLDTENGRCLVDSFVRIYPEAAITKIKMLDLVLWQTR